jgi:Cytochrome oxidase complex assembly protein 1
MTTKKIIIIVLLIIVIAGLVVVLFAGGIVGFAVYSIGKSEAATTAKTFLRGNEKLKQDIGDVQDFGSFVTGSINVQNSNGEARLNLKVIGARKTVNATVDLTYRGGRAWHVTGASYTNDQGQSIELFNPYNSRLFSLRLAA